MPAYDIDLPLSLLSYITGSLDFLKNDKWFSKYLNVSILQQHSEVRSLYGNIVFLNYFLNFSYMVLNVIFFTKFT